MGRKDRIQEERIRYWIKFLSIFLVLSIACLLVVFYFYNRNIMKNSTMKIDEIASVERIILNDSVNNKNNKNNKNNDNNDNIIDVSTSEDKTINDISNTLTKGKLEANIASNKDKKVIKNENKDNVKKEENKKNIEIEEKLGKVESKDIELSKINAINNEINTEIKKEEEVPIDNLVSIESVTELKFETPLSGEIIKDYAKDTLVYSNTLEEWCVHLGIDIKAPKTTVVKASEKGVIEKITTDPRYGNSITINHGNGFKTVYSSLLVSDFFKVGEEVQKGDNIGTVGDSASFEKADDAHLHFEMYKDGENVNPTIYLK